MNRHVAAFVLAPLIVPLLMSALAIPILREEPSLYWRVLIIAATVSYTGLILVGAPAYVGFRSVGWTAFWIAPLVGFVVGVIIAIGLIALFLAAARSGTLNYILGTNVEISSTTDEGQGPPWALIVPGVIGAVVGMALWLIGRPDRP